MALQFCVDALIGNDMPSAVPEDNAS